jgi:hypothetical protein
MQLNVGKLGMNVSHGFGRDWRLADIGRTSAWL